MLIFILYAHSSTEEVYLKIKFSRHLASFSSPEINTQPLWLDFYHSRMKTARHGR